MTEYENVLIGLNLHVIMKTFLIIYRLQKASFNAMVFSLFPSYMYTGQSKLYYTHTHTHN